MPARAQQVRSNEERTMARGYSRTQAGSALMDVIWLTLQASFKLRAFGRRHGFISARGGVWGLLRSLKEHGPQTVPALARMRPVSRQHIQTLVDAMAEDGFVMFKPNLAHKRSQLVAITPEGERLYEALAHKLGAISDELAAGLDAKKLAATGEILACIDAKLGGILSDAVGDEEEPRRRKRGSS
jgi:DNA-binding MarR family transcriptional regulator